MVGDTSAQPVYAYLALSGVLSGVWLVLYLATRAVRREMVEVSLGTMLLGLTEPLFVPEYWNPPTLLNLAKRTGFDLESLVFSFAIGGIVFAAYHVLVGAAPSQSIPSERHRPRHRYHWLALVAAPLLFAILLALTPLNPIYAAALALVGGFFATLKCRPDLWLKMLVSGVLFLVLYFVVFALFDAAFPGYVAAVWRLDAISGLLLWGVPLEELMFAFTFGLYWSSVYEHITWRLPRPAPLAAPDQRAPRPSWSSTGRSSGSWPSPSRAAEPRSGRAMRTRPASLDLRVRLLMDPCLWCWEIADPDRNGALLYSSWADEWKGYESREEALRAGEVQLAALARAA